MAAGRDRLFDFPWAGSDTPRYLEYMTREWGIPVRDPERLFEMLILQTFQSGLSWAVILNKREHFRNAFADWDLDAVCRFAKRDEERLMRDAGIVRNRAKIRAAIGNARALRRIRDEEGSFVPFLWQFTGGETVRPARRYRRWEELPDRTPASEAMSRTLRKEGFRYLGPVACYAFMQAVGMVDDRIAGFPPEG